MSIAKRLVILIASLIIGLALIAGTSMIQMRDQISRINWINTNINPSLVVIDRINVEFSDIRILALKHILSPGDTDKKTMEDEITTLRGKINGDLKLYLETLITNDRDRELLLAEQAKIAEYYHFLDQLLPLSRSHQSEQANELNQNSQPMIISVSQALKDHFDYNLQLANDAGTQAEVSGQRSLIGIAVVALIAMAIGLMIGFTTYRLITN
jgi:methyl-accepting chemotaxis protein